MNISMEFIIPDVPAHLVKQTTDIPEKYHSYLWMFARPLLVTSPSVDILYQERNANGSTISNVIFFVREKVRLLPKTREPLSTFNCMLAGSVQVHLKGIGTVWLFQGQYNVFQVPPAEHEAWFDPGIYEAHHHHYTRGVLEHLAHTTPLVKSWLRKVDSNMAAYLTPMPCILFKELYALIDLLKHNSIDTPLRVAWLETKLQECLILLLEHQSAVNVVNHESDDPLIATVLAYVDNNLDKDITLDSLAKAYYTSTSTLRRHFLEHYGRNFKRYLLEKRMQAALDMLQKGNTSIADVAQAVGYHSASGFTREFKAFTGNPPSYYIKSRIE